MEVEAKLVVPDSAVARKLRAVQRMGDFTYSAPERIVVRDTFFDTRARDLSSGKHVLRIRQRNDGRTVVTFKAPASRDNAIHSRPETEVEMQTMPTPRALNAASLPAQVRKLVAPLAKDDTLYPLFAISQTRDLKTVRHGRRIVAEWSLDRVTFRAGKRQRAFYELEIELKKTGTPDELTLMVEWVTREFQLAAMPESKFARALKFMQNE